MPNRLHPMRWTATLLVTLLLAALLVGCSEARSKDHGPGGHVATAGSVAVTAESFRTQYAAYLLQTGVPDAPALRRAFLDQLVAARLLVAQTRAEGIEAEAAYRFRSEHVRRKLLIEAYVHRALFDTLQVREADLRAAFLRSQTRITARHLYAPTRAQAAALYARLQAGERFEDLAREVFADPALAETGGSLGTFGFDETDPAFEEAAFSLAVGAVSEPVRTAQGYSIIQVQDRFTHPLLTETAYAGQKDGLRPYVRRRLRLQARRAHVQDLQAGLGITFHEAALERLLAQVTGQALGPDAEAFDAWLAEPLVSFGPPGQRRTWTVGQFREQARFTDERQRAQVRSRADLEAFIGGLAARAAMLTQAEAWDLDTEPAFEDAMAEEMDGWVLQEARRRLGAEVEVPEDSLHAAFAAATASEFTIPERVRVGEIVTATRAEADGLLARWPDASFEDLGFLGREQLGALADSVFEAPAGRVVGPFEVEGRYVLLQVGAREPARPMTYAEARPLLYEQLHSRQAEARLRTAYDALRAAHPAKVDTDLLYSLTLKHEPTD